MRSPLHTITFGALLYTTYVGTLVISGNHPQEFFWGFSTTVIPAIEIIFFCSLAHTLTLVEQPKLRLPLYLLALAALTGITIIYAIQLLAVVISNDYITALALENATETQYIASPVVISSLVVGTGLYLLACWRSYIKQTNHHRLTKKTLSTTVVSGLLFIALFDASSESSKNPNLLRPDLAPATGFLKTYKDLLMHSDHELEVSKYLEAVKKNLAKKPALFDPDSSYPFFRQSTDTSGFPFETSGTYKHGEKFNLIVIFAEGFSARLMSEYGGKHRNLTPNLDKLAKASMIVKGYYNHTAATYRGLQGQLTSAWSTKTGGSVWRDWDHTQQDINDPRSTLAARSIATMLKTQGYETAFISPHNNSNPLNKMITALGFDQVFSHENISQLLGKSPTPFPIMSQPTSSDEDVFEALKNYVAEREEIGSSKPFFISTYNIGTHAFMDSAPSATKYGSGENPALNRFHEFDRALGNFIDYFLTSRIKDKTILVVTADHASYPEPSFIKAITDEAYQAYFVDQIPLIILSPHLLTPRQFDAHVRTSIDLAPSLFHLLGISDIENAFAGRSIFNEHPNNHLGIASISDDFYSINPDGIEKVRLRSMSAEVSELVNTARLFTTLESQNLLIPPEEANLIRDRSLRK